MNRELGIPLILFLIFTFTIIPAFVPVKGQTTQYTINGTVSTGELDYYWISNVRQGDLFLLNVTEAAFQLSYANLTVIDTSGNVIQFIANTTSDLLLRIGPNRAGDSHSVNELNRPGISYTIQCSHPFTKQVMANVGRGDVIISGVDFWRISNVTKGDLFLLIVSGNWAFDWETQLSYANLTVIDTNNNSGDHIVQFYANVTGDLILRITPSWDGDKSYTIQCTHLLSRTSMYAAAGTVAGGGADFWKISNVTKGDLVLLVVNGEGFWDWESQLSYTNLSVIDTIGGTTGAPSNANHIFQFYANSTSDLLLRISPPWTGDMAYSIQCTHFIPSHNIAVTSVSTDKNTVQPGAYVTVYANVSNLGNYIESFNVTAYYGSKSIGMVNIINLTSLETRIISFQWDTTGVTLGNYSVSVKADTVNLEVATADNSLGVGYVLVRNPVTPTPTQTSTPTQTGTPTHAPTQTGGSYLTWLLDNPTMVVVIALVVIALLIGIARIARIRNKGPNTLARSPPFSSAGNGTVICGACGTQNPSSGEFCLQCGARLKGEETRVY